MLRYIISSLILTTFTNGNPLSFPKYFKFGLATASYQIEGGWNASGKGENIWDRLTHWHPTWVKDRSTGDIACDSYHLWKEDIRLLKYSGVDFYRFSLSWSRILPSGFSNYINPDGVRYYNNIIDELLKNDIEPMVTLFHWDLPQPLQDLGGWPNEVIADHFQNYADVAFKLFGDRVKLWITMNEPPEICGGGYGDGTQAPGIHSSGIAEYLCGRTVLLAHANAYHLYNEVYKPKQNGQVGIVIDSLWGEPKTTSPEDVEAAERFLQMNFGWWAHPIFSKSGDYPQVMKDRIGNNSKAENFSESRLPSFTQKEINFIRGSSDFFGLNHYTTRIMSDITIPVNAPVSYYKDVSVMAEVAPDWKRSAASWLYDVPWGLRKLLNWIKREYDNPIVFITENGYADNGELEDYSRITYYHGYLDSVLKAVLLDGCNVRRYTAWSLMDNMEWMDGYTLKFGLYYVNFTDPSRPRKAKESLEYYKYVINSRMLLDNNVEVNLS